MQSGELELRLQLQCAFAFRHGDFSALIAWQFCLKLVARRGLNIAADKFEEEQQFFFVAGASPTAPNISSYWREDFLSTTEALTTGKKLAVSAATLRGILAKVFAAVSPHQMACDQHASCGLGTGTDCERLQFAAVAARAIATMMSASFALFYCVQHPHQLSGML